MNRYLDSKVFFFACGFGAASLSVLALSKLLRPKSINHTDYYENDEVVNQYLNAHYTMDEECITFCDLKDGLGYHTRCIRILEEFIDLKKVYDKEALDIGCAVGRLSFELSRFYKSVDAFDYSRKFIDICQKLKQSKTFQYSFTLDGHIKKDDKVVLKGYNEDRVHFWQMDAAKFRTSKKYDCVTVINIIDRLKHPKQFLERLKDFMNPGGFLLITSPFTWSTEFTPEDEWLDRNEEGAYDSSDKNVMDILTRSGFELITKRNMPLLIPETKRKFQWIVTFAMLWKMNASTAQK